MVMQDAIRSLVDRRELSPDQATRAMEAIMGGEATPAQVGGYRSRVRLVGESPAVLSASAAGTETLTETVDVPIGACGRDPAETKELVRWRCERVFGKDGQQVMDTIMRPGNAVEYLYATLENLGRCER